MRDSDEPAGLSWLAKIGICSAIFVVLLIITLTFVVKIATISGNEMAVHETWGGGVDPTPMFPGTTVWCPGFTHKYFVYDMSSQVYVMNDKPIAHEGPATGREKDAYKVQSKEGQDLTVSLNVRWRLDPEKLIDIHRHIRTDFEDKILRPALLRVVKDESTVRKATEAYSGEGLVALQKAIATDLTRPDSDVRRQGIIVETFVIEHIELDPKYIDEIKLRQVAVQRELRVKQEEIAANAEANKVKAESQADLNRQVVAAQRDKEIGVLNAERKSQEQVIAAQADKQRVVLNAEAEKEGSVLRSQAILAMGQASAEAKRLEMTAYTSAGAETFARIEVSKHMGTAFQNFRGYMPEKMTMNVVTGNFLEGINEVLHGKFGQKPMDAAMEKTNQPAR